MGAAVAVVDFDRDGWQDFYVTNSGEGSLNRLYRNKGDGTFADVAGRLGVADVNQRGHRRVDGRGLGRLRQRRLRGSVPLQVRPAGAVPQRRRARLHPRVRARRAAALGQRQQRHLVRLRPRRLARSVPRRLLAGGRRPLAPEDDADHAGELRVRGERRPEVPVPQPRRRHVRGDVGGRSGSARAAGRWPSAAADLFGHRAIRICSSPTTTASPSSTSTRAASGSSRSARETGVGRTPKSGMNASFGDIFNDGRLSIYKTNISEPGVLVQGNDLWVPKAPARRRRALEFENLASSARASISAAGAGARSSAISTTTARSTSTWSTATSRPASARATGTTSREIAVGHSAHHRRRGATGRR